MISFEVTGERELVERLGRLPAAAAGRLGEEALIATASPLLAAVEELSPRRSGTLAESFGISPVVHKQNTASLEVHTTRWYSGKQFYGAFQEFGWRVGKRVRAKGREAINAARRLIAGKHFTRRAVETRGQQALEIGLETLRDGLAREVSGG